MSSSTPPPFRGQAVVAEVALHVQVDTAAVPSGRQPVEVGGAGPIEETRRRPGRVAERVEAPAGVLDVVDRRVAADEVVSGFAVEQGVGTKSS